MRIKSTNHYLEIGSSHDDCQDFAISGMINPNLAYAILSDGCSASHDICREVDFGARMLCYSARKLLMEKYRNVNELTAPFTSDDVHAILTKSSGVAEENRKFYDLHPAAIDATLLICLSDGKRHNIVIYGDGGFVYKRNGEKTLIYTNVDFESGAPYYPSYSISADRMQSYQDAFGKDDVKLHTIKINEDGTVERSDMSLTRSFCNLWYNQTIFSLEGQIPFIALTSDGVKSFQRPHKDYPEIIQTLEPEIVVPKMFGYKNLNGQFIERRMKKFKMEIAEEKWTHYDDVSVSGISTAW